MHHLHFINSKEEGFIEWMMKVCGFLKKNLETFYIPKPQPQKPSPQNPNKEKSHLFLITFAPISSTFFW